VKRLCRNARTCRLIRWTLASAVIRVDSNRGKTLAVLINYAVTNPVARSVPESKYLRLSPAPRRKVGDRSFGSDWPSASSCTEPRDINPYYDKVSSRRGLNVDARNRRQLGDEALRVGAIRRARRLQKRRKSRSHSKRAALEPRYSTAQLREQLRSRGVGPSFGTLSRTPPLHADGAFDDGADQIAPSPDGNALASRSLRFWPQHSENRVPPQPRFLWAKIATVSTGIAPPFGRGSEGAMARRGKSPSTALVEVGAGEAMVAIWP